MLRSLPPLVAVLFAIGLVPLWSGCEADRERAPEEQAGATIENGTVASAPLRPRQPAPDFTLESPDGEPFTLSDYRGEVVILNFWATWCAPCVVEVPELMEVHDDLRDDGVFVVGVSQDTGPGAHTDVRDFRDMFEVNYPLLLDPGLRVGQAYGGHISLPTTFVIDREGQIHARRVGLLNRRDLFNMMEGLIDAADGPRALIEEHPYAPPGAERDTVLIDDLVPTALTAQAVAALVDMGAMIIDLRDENDQRSAGGIPFALTQSLEALRRDDLPANLGAPIIFIATDEADAWQAAGVVSSWGYVSSHPLAGGFAAWAEAGLPVDTFEILSQILDG